MVAHTRGGWSAYGVDSACEVWYRQVQAHQRLRWASWRDAPVPQQAASASVTPSARI